MTELSILLLAISASTLGVISHLRIFMTSQGKKETSASHLEAPEAQRDQNDDPIAVPLKPGALQLPLLPSNFSFSDALDYNTAGHKISNGLMEGLTQMLGSDLVLVGLEVINLKERSKYFLAKYPEHATAIKKAKEATEMTTAAGEKLAVLKDSSSGQIIALGRTADPSVLLKIAEVGTVIVNASHLISNWDNAKKIKLINQKLDHIILHFKNQQISELEAGFETIKEYCYSKNRSQAYLIELKFNLKRLRSQWMREANDVLDFLKNPNARSRISKQFDWLNQKNIRNMEQSAMAIEKPLLLAHFAYLMESTISQIIQDEPQVLEITKSDMRNQICELQEKVMEKIDWVECLDESYKTSFSNELLGFCDRFLESLEQNTFYTQAQRPKKKAS